MAENARVMEVKRVGFVTRRFSDLQGLRLVGAGIQLALYTAVFTQFNRGGLDQIAQMGGLVLVITLGAWIDHAVPEYYGRRVGRVVAERPHRWAAIRAVWIVFWMLPVPFGGPFRMLWLIWGLCPVWLILDGWPFRVHHAATLAVALYLAWMRILAPAGVVEASRVIISGTYLLSVAMILTGLADHAVLLRAFRPTHDGQCEAASVEGS